MVVCTSTQDDLYLIHPFSFRPTKPMPSTPTTCSSTLQVMAPWFGYSFLLCLSLAKKHQPESCNQTAAVFYFLLYSCNNIHNSSTSLEEWNLCIIAILFQQARRWPQGVRPQSQSQHTTFPWLWLCIQLPKGPGHPASGLSSVCRSVFIREWSKFNSCSGGLLCHNVFKPWRPQAILYHS